MKKTFFVIGLLILPIWIGNGCGGGSSPTSPAPSSSGPIATATLPCLSLSQFGKTSVGLIPSAGVTNALFATKATLSDIASVFRLNVYASNVAGQITTAIYDDAGGVPRNLLVHSASQTVVLGWNSFLIPTTTLGPGTYWLTLEETQAVTFAYTSVTNAAYAGPATYGTFPSVFPLGVAGNGQMSFYADYCPLIATSTTSSTPTFTPTPTGSATLTPTPGIGCPSYQFGKTTLGATNSSGAVNALYAERATVADNAVLYRLQFYITNPQGQVQVAVYGDNVGHPGSLLVSSNPQSVVSGWNGVDLNFPVTVAPGTYWLALQENAVVTASFDAVANSAYAASYSGFGTFPGTFPSGFPMGSQASFYAEYCLDTQYSTSTTTPTPTITFTPTVTLTPTFTETPYCNNPYQVGETTQYSDTQNGYGQVFAYSVSMPGDGKVMSLTAHIASVSGSQLRAALYADNNFSPGSLLVESNPQTPVVGWNTVDIPDWPVTAGPYWLALQVDGYLTVFSGYGTLIEAFQPVIGPFPADLSGSPGTGAIPSLYANFCQTQGALTFTPTFTVPPTDTFTPTISPTPTNSLTPTDTPTSTDTPTPTETPLPLITGFTIYPPKVYDLQTDSVTLTIDHTLNVDQAITLTTPDNLSWNWGGPATVLAGQLTAVLPVTAYGSGVKSLVATLYGQSVTLGVTIVGSPLLITQVYGGNTTGPYDSDYIELHNRSVMPVTVDGWSVEYETGGYSGFNDLTPLSGVIPEGAFYLVQEAGGGTGTALPAADATGNIDISPTVGKVALEATTVLYNSCAYGDMDLVGYGSGANCSEFGPAASPGVNSALGRTDPCVDTDNNPADLAVITASPRNSLTAPVTCP